jgi:YbbR domain-containing protein
MKTKLTDNLFLKLLSLVLAVILWLAVINISDAEGTKTFQREVTLLNTEIITENGQVYRVEDNTNIVKVTVRARKSVLDKLNESDFTLIADMKKDLKYDSLVGITVQCKNRDINVDENVTLNRHNVSVSIEDSATEQFPVIVRHTGKPTDGLVVGSLVPELTVIKISGPVSIVERIKLVEALVDVTGLPGNTVKTCSLNLYDGADGLINTTYLNFVGKSDGIDVTVSLLNTKTVPMKFRYSGTPAENYQVTRISCKPETIDIAGTSDVLAGISRLEFPAEAINIDGIDEELQAVVDVTQYLPSGIILEKEEEASVLVTVEVEYVEPVEEDTEESDDEEDEEDKKPIKPSGGTTSENKPSDDSKPSDGPTTDSGNENTTPDTEGTENSGSENDNETESGTDVKTESNS